MHGYYHFISESERKIKTSTYIGGVYGYSFGKVYSGLYVVNIKLNGKTYIKSVFVPMETQKTVDITLNI